MLRGHINTIPNGLTLRIALDFSSCRANSKFINKTASRTLETWSGRYIPS